MATIPISANQLRALAERADSDRNKTVYLVENPDGKPEPYDIVDEASINGRRVAMTLNTVDGEPCVTKQGSLTLTSEPVVYLPNRTESLAGCDAVFTSLTAVEKFVVPYYARHRTPDSVKELRDKFAMDPWALGMVHTPDSVESIARKQGAPPPPKGNLLVLQQRSDANKFIQPMDNAAAIFGTPLDDYLLSR